MLQDKWVCPVCENENKPLNRYCDFCWNLRPDWLPNSSRVDSRPATDVRRDLPSSAEPPASLDSGLMSPASCAASPDRDERSPTSPIGSRIPAQSAEIPVSPAKLTVNTPENEVTPMDTDGYLLNANVQHRDKNWNRESSHLNPTDALLSVCSGASSVCVICLAAPKTASIVHGMTGHQACCFRCARQLKHSGKPCPVCRRPINKVIRNYIL